MLSMAALGQAMGELPQIVDGVGLVDNFNAKQRFHDVLQRHDAFGSAVTVRYPRVSSLRV